MGLVGFAVDAATYNLLVFFEWHGWSWRTLDGHGILFSHPLTAKIIAIAVATAVTYVGNRYWVFTGRRDDGHARHLVLYTVVNVAAIGLQLACLGFSRYVLGLDSPLADNVSGTLIGQIVAVVFRYWAYDTLVFRRHPSERGD
ncbi:GtrA family protein [Dietzia sp. 179-F 9C3 NHS]|uniref:GtrA family protein n=1 Tax=Dietzia sp. 179-F 9C3 NHS TaxID=3374295 RepID=UPI00387A4033